MDIEFDPAKDEANIAKHGISLATAADLEIRAFVRDGRRDYAEERFNAFGLLDGQTYCLTFVVRAAKIRAISLRRARAKEYLRHVV